MGLWEVKSLTEGHTAEIIIIFIITVITILKSLFVNYSVPYTAHLAFPMEQETREAQAPQ